MKQKHRHQVPDYVTTPADIWRTYSPTIDVDLSEAAMKLAGRFLTVLGSIDFTPICDHSSESYGACARHPRGGLKCASCMAVHLGHARYGHAGPCASCGADDVAQDVPLVHARFNVLQQRNGTYRHHFGNTFGVATFALTGFDLCARCLTGSVQ